MLVWHKDCFYCHSCMDGVGEGRSLLPCEHFVENHAMDIGTCISARASFDYLTEGERQVDFIRLQ
ncbi:hypothetical protein C1H46_006761 [Malus baccata]|uniref:LIM zinc-binding domain-containing protein n=1 Tax=Malus baccata TaxID=106549 RepID=A0A540N988_MALBA|nr:hypothetical protein C1H46_006761 [Malus baccata]